MNLKILPVILLAAFIFVSCEKDVVFNGVTTTPLLVVNSFVTPDSVVTAYISESRFFLKDSLEFRKVNNAEVNLWINGTLKEKMTLDSAGIYRSIYKPMITDQIKLTVDAPQMQQALATTGFIEAPVILSTDTQKVFVSKEVLWYNQSLNDTLCVKYNYKVNYKLKFTDNGNQKNYYRLIVRKVSYDGVWNYRTNRVDTIINNNNPRYSDFDFSDVVSGNTNDPLSDSGTSPVGGLLSESTNIYHVFSDDLFNGKSYSLHFSTNFTKIIENIQSGSVSDIKHEVYISLQSISKDYYQYLMTRSTSRTINNFSEPVKVYNNINGGIGMLGSYTTSNIIKIELP